MDDFDDLIEDALDVDVPSAADGLLPPVWGEEPPRSSTQQSEPLSLQARGSVGAGLAADSQSSMLGSNLQVAASQLTTPIASQVL
jgi:hypothetical protein